MGKGKLNELDRLLDEVARGQRRLDSIKDAKLREAARVALRIHASSQAAPDDYARLRMRARVLARLDPRGPNLADHAWTALEFLARPAPYIVRGVALATLLFVGGMGASVVAADTLPDDLLYPLKTASETVRLALAAMPDDRASVELSIAEHRLAEAEQLAFTGRTDDALVASAMYSQHVASAAAELVPNESSPVAQQLETTFAQQRDRASTIATALSANTNSAPAAQVLATIAKSAVASGPTVAERVAQTAAGLAQELAVVAEHATIAPAHEENRTSASTATRTTTQPGAHATDAPRATTAAERRAGEVLRVVRKAADDAKAAADKTKSHK